MQTTPTVNYLNDTIATTWRLLLVGALCVMMASPVAAQGNPNPMDVNPGLDDPQRTVPLEPFQIVDNIYSVGARIHHPVWLITTPAGHILIETTYEHFVPEIVKNIEQLGFNVRDIKYLLASHAHGNHVGGHAAMQEITGAMIIVMAGDVDVVESGGATDFRNSDTWTPAEVDRVIHDLDRVRLGDTVLTAHLTPGHTKGCTTWTTVVEYNNQEHDVVFYCGMNINPNEALIGNPKYPNAAEDFAYSFAKLKTLPVDFFLGLTGYWFDFEAKIEKMKQGGGPEIYIDPAGYRYKVNSQEEAYIKQLRQERAIAPPV